ncbi:MAG: hypothetical protein DWQ47_03605 [Acidobacteria bacterium]|nr:MAG: hypothetical protein DWQ32_07155 [Acidobacteriota bacterium]REK01487.1 MAG: hypothetical protein DWQ38_03590 [Acidobacteriota bacterium]REK14443.1 MAG: hypothetical protein DWQ43_12845 [Acidobacteriota bacterium]REK45158.1 MAG: hypothetical protein DWQ47_03605 [Acidobacteriota bacterium]
MINDRNEPSIPPEFRSPMHDQFDLPMNKRGMNPNRLSKENESDRKKIIGLIPRGEVIRNFVYSRAFDEVNERADLDLFAVPLAAQIKDDLEGRFGKIYELDEGYESWPVRFQRELIDISHNRWLWSRAAKERSRLRDSEAVSLLQKSKRSVKKLISYPFSTPGGLRLLNKAERSTSKLLSQDDYYERLFKKLSPSLVFNGSHVHSRVAIQAVQAAQWLGIPTATFIFSWDNLTSQGRITLPYDYFLVWNKSLKDQLVAMYDWVREENVFVTGTPQFDFHFRDEFYLSREEYCQQVGADPERPIVLYTTGMANHMPGEPEIVEQIADMLGAYDAEPRPQLLVRVYAKDRTGRFEDLKRRRKDILFPEVEWEEAWLTPKAEDTYALVNALRHCALGINVASTVSLELCMFDKPVINVGYNPSVVPKSVLSYADYYEFDHYKPVVESGAVRVAFSQEEMCSLIDESLAAPEEHSRKRTALVDGMFGSTLDGRSGERVAEVLLSLAARSE